MFDPKSICGPLLVQRPSLRCQAVHQDTESVLDLLTCLEDGIYSACVGHFFPTLRVRDVQKHFCFHLVNTVIKIVKEILRPLIGFIVTFDIYGVILLHTYKKKYIYIYMSTSDT